MTLDTAADNVHRWPAVREQQQYMTSDAPADNDMQASRVPSPTASAPGVTLADFIGGFEQRGLPCALTAGATQGWIPGVRGELQRFPNECTGPVDSATRRRLLRRRGIWIVSCLVEPDRTHPPNCFNYVCRNREYDLSKLRKQVRKTIRRGMRQLDIRLCTWDEIAEHGRPAYDDTLERHGFARSAGDGVKRASTSKRDLRFHEAWGAWHHRDLVAWLTLGKIDNWAFFINTCSCSHALRLGANSALRHVVTHHVLVEENREWISSGVSSIYAGTQWGIHRYKVRSGYQAIPRHRQFFLHPLVRPFIEPAACSWAIEKLASGLPHMENLRKLSGLSRLLSGREKDPLAWAQGQDADDDDEDLESQAGES